MIKVLKYAIENDDIGYVVYRQGMKKADKKGIERVIDSKRKYVGTFEQAIKVVMRESFHDWVEETQSDALELKDALRKIDELKADIERAVKGA